MRLGGGGEVVELSVLYSNSTRVVLTTRHWIARKTGSAGIDCKIDLNPRCEPDNDLQWLQPPCYVAWCIACGSNYEQYE